MSFIFWTIERCFAIVPADFRTLFDIVNPRAPNRQVEAGKFRAFFCGRLLTAKKARQRQQTKAFRINGMTC